MVSLPPRPGSVTVAKPVMAPREVIEAMRQGGPDKAFGILFGRERSGLTNVDVVLADTVLTVPLNPAFQSLNLAQAVAIMAYECFTAPVPEKQPEPEIGERPATKAELMGMMEQLETGLDDAGYFDPVPAKKPSMVRNLRNIFQQADLLETGRTHPARVLSRRWRGAGIGEATEMAEFDPAAAGITFDYTEGQRRAPAITPGPAAAAVWCSCTVFPISGTPGAANWLNSARIIWPWRRTCGDSIYRPSRGM